MTAISFYRYELVDEVMTLTLSEKPEEEGFTVHFMHATWEDDEHTHEVANGSDDSAETAVTAWSIADRVLSVTFEPEAAEELGFDEDLELELELPDAGIAEVRRRLTEILVDVPESR
ncbi:hypothetical protein [Paractinoplanes durhamensis]|uniref:Uncharacterized protein n=1 Tax=Paractinoplanes durhamensis TaxID=113563 RepID=A0ABQ3YNW8_9ACTN|nr:hypothetical protein [Actinoplanes durhamensis]GID99256.1 hypothetical protein Adu01nite_06070 [Actinoplanes durhamensis]